MVRPLPRQQLLDLVTTMRNHYSEYSAQQSHGGPPDRLGEETENHQMGDYAKALGAKLRGIRQQQGLSLHGVEQKSGGRWKAVVVGSYERGDRAVTVQKLAELADFYGVPVVELLPEGRVPSGAEPATKIVINLERLQQLPAEKVGPLARYAATIQSQRGDYNGKVLSIRTEDLRSLAIIYDMTPGELTEQLIEWGVLPPEARPAKED
ncbi:Helix-turn-helix [Amycolatopsis sacchari]|uniref:Helix-turn-helix n=4 Tax=Pseudonocardiaceae TaxID=2070 RepID=A0A1I3TD41_9PSEU|nr:Helix-turn-helix [Amycolatopsis sacchari]